MFFYAKEIDIFEYFSSQPDYIQLQGILHKDLDNYISPQLEELFSSIIFSEISCNVKIICSDECSSAETVPTFAGKGSTHKNGTHLFLEASFTRDRWKHLDTQLKLQSAFDLKINFSNVTGRIIDISEDGFTSFKIGVDLDFLKWSKRTSHEYRS